MYSPDVFLFQLWTSPLFHASYNSCFLTCVQTSQETTKEVKYFYLFKDFPIVVIYTVKYFRIVNEAEVDFFFPRIFLPSL